MTDAGHSSRPPARRPRDDPGAMIDVDEARARILAAFAPLPMMRVPSPTRSGCVLAVDVIAGSQRPALPQRGDGRVRGARGRHGRRHAERRPCCLRVIAEAAAGYAPRGRVDAGNGRPHHDRSAGARRAPMPSCASRRRTRATAAAAAPATRSPSARAAQPGEQRPPRRRGRARPARRSSPAGHARAAGGDRRAGHAQSHRR